MKDILIVGIAGSGKGTQAREIIENLGSGIQYFEPGSVLRALGSNENIVGDYVKQYTSAGRLLPDMFMKSLLGVVFASLHEGSRLLVDGFPRMHSQKLLFDELMEVNKRDFIVFHLDISEEEAIKRLLARRICPTCGTTYNTHLHGDLHLCPSDGATLKQRADDLSLDAIHERFKLYHTETAPIIAEYTSMGKVVKIDGTKSIEDITKEILDHIA